VESALGIVTLLSPCGEPDPTSAVPGIFTLTDSGDDDSPGSTGAVVFTGAVAGVSVGISSGRGATVSVGNGVSEASGAGSSMITISEPGRDIGDVGNVAPPAAGSEADVGTVVEGVVSAGMVVEGDGSLDGVHEWS
ncbi:MAG: hypothetical protein RLY24_362, partial [Actinomycetota bacterium]